MCPQTWTNGEDIQPSVSFHLGAFSLIAISSRWVLSHLLLLVLFLLFLCVLCPEQADETSQELICERNQSAIHPSVIDSSPRGGRVRGDRRRMSSKQIIKQLISTWKLVSFSSKDHRALPPAVKQRHAPNQRKTRPSRRYLYSDTPPSSCR